MLLRKGNMIRGTLRGYSRRGSHLLGRLYVNIPILAIIAYFCAFALSPSIQAAEFSCPSGDVDCLIASIKEANANGAATNTISLGPGKFTLTQPFNSTDTIDSVDGPAGLPRIRSTG